MIAKLYHDNTNLTSRTTGVFVETANRARQQSLQPFGYSKCPSIKLEDGNCRISLADAMSRRESSRDFIPTPVSFTQVSKLFNSAIGAGKRRSSGMLQRPYPSAGGLYPVNCYLIAQNIEGLARGIYHVNGGTRSLELIRAECAGQLDCSALIRTAILGEPSIHRAAFFVVMTGDLDKTCWKYGERGYRFVLLEAGHIAQNLALAAVGCNLANVALGGFCETELQRFLEVDEFGHRALYVLAFGDEQEGKSK